MSLFDRNTIARIVIATAIVLPPVVGYQQRQQDKATAKTKIERAQDKADLALSTAGLVAKEKIERTIADCQSANEQRIIRIATSQAIIRISVSNVPPQTLRDELLLAAFVQKANAQIVKAAGVPKVCTVHALHLDGLALIVKAAQPKSSGGAEPSGSGAPPAIPPVHPARTTLPPTTRARGRAVTTTTVCQPDSQPGQSDCHRHRPKP